jgi:hypothetical protein
MFLELFLYVDIKNKKLYKKKYYFNIFLIKKYQIYIKNKKNICYSNFETKIPNAMMYGIQCRNQ